MSWEVSSMQSKKSFFNGTLFRKNLTRSWPLWGIISLIGALFPLYMLLELMQRRNVQVFPTEFADVLYNAVTMFAPGFIAAYAVLCAIVVWGYLYNTRSVGMFHALPVDRTCLFVTNTLSGLTMILIPFAVVGFLLCLVSICWGFFNLIAVLNTILAVLMLAVTFFGLATLCAMLTGHIVMLPVLYLLANFLAPLLEALIINLAEQFLIGISIGAMQNSLIFSPLFEIYAKFHSYYDYYSYSPGLEDYAPSLVGLWVVALYALAGLALLALAWFLYKKRHSESAGDVVAFRWMQPIFRYGIALLSALTLGRLLYELLWHDLFQKGDYADALPMFVCAALTGLVGYYAASMLIAKSKRVFRGSLTGVGIVCAGAAALILLVSVDVLGIERRIPAMDDIASVSLTDRNETISFDADKNPEQVEAIRAFHQVVINDRNYIRTYIPDWHMEGDKVFGHNIWLTYRLKDGTTVRRFYDLWFNADRAGQDGTYENQLIRFYEDAEVRQTSVTIAEDTSLTDIDVYNIYSDEYCINTTERNSNDAKTIYAALLKDVDEGNVPAENVLAQISRENRFWLMLNYRMRESSWDNSWTYSCKNVDLHPTMTNTIDTLLELGYVTEEQLTLWQSDYDEDNIDRYAEYLIKDNGPHAETFEIG